MRVFWIFFGSLKAASAGVLEMRRIADVFLAVALSVAGLILFLSVSHRASAATPTMVADALDWYSVWLLADPVPSQLQTCQGEFQDAGAQFRCDPLNVVVSVSFGSSGECYITNMSPGVGTAVDTRLLGPPAVLRTDGTIAPLDLGVTRPSPTSPQCEGLPQKRGELKFDTAPRARPVDEALSKLAVQAALSYQRYAVDQSCVLYIPNVRTGDPFAHVYKVCHGILDSVQEFPISQNQVEDFPHWTYDRPHRNIPSGAEARLQKASLWFVISTPADRGRVNR